MSDDCRERRFTLHLPSGRILEGDHPELPNTVEDIPDEQWREIGSIDPGEWAQHCRPPGIEV
jgi:hypothetical protein